jgi:predicted  nucleic acid-binding Zn-ribbon protein
MSTMSKVFVVLNLVLSLFLVGTNASILSKNEEFKNKYETSEAARKDDKKAADAKLDAVNGEKARIDLTNRGLENQKSDLESQLTAQKATAEQVRNDNNQLRNSVDAINIALKAVQGELGDVQARNKALMDSNEALKKETADAKKAQMDAEEDRARVEGDLKRATDDVAEKERQLVALTGERDNMKAELDSLVKLGVDVPGLIGNNVPLIEGKVSAVGPNSSFVVLSVGQNESVKIGYAFDVYRGGDYIGRVVVDNVLPDSATARVTRKNQKGLEFQAMDNATTRL